MDRSLIDAIVEYQVKQKSMWIETYSGQRISFKNPDRSKINIVDIARGLSNACRFAGQGKYFYSVAEHSVLVSLLLEMTGESPAVVLAGFMHDSPEAYLGDPTTPLKILCPGFLLIEQYFEALICGVFGITESFNEGPVKRADYEMFCREKEFLLSKWDERPAETFGPPLEIRCLAPKEAESLFLNRARELGIEV